MSSEVPSVIVHCAISIDGRVTPGPGQCVPRDAWGLKLYLDLQQRLECDATMVGSNTILELKAPNPVSGPGEKLKGETESIMIIPDSRGRVKWSGWQKDPWLTGLVVLCSKITPSTYIKHLHEEQIPYIMAGEHRVDLRAALKEIRQRYRVKRIVCQGGGAINGALLRTGLVTEISVLIVPFAIGGINTPTLFDAPNLRSPEDMTRLNLIHSERFKDNFVWLRYQITK